MVTNSWTIPNSLINDETIGHGFSMSHFFISHIEFQTLSQWAYIINDTQVGVKNKDGHQLGASAI